jgi:hypothetical protein
MNDVDSDQRRLIIAVEEGPCNHHVERPFMVNLSVCLHPSATVNPPSSGAWKHAEIRPLVLNCCSPTSAHAALG